MSINIKKKGTKLFAVVLTMLMVVGMIPVGFFPSVEFLAPSAVGAQSVVPDAPTRDQASIINFVQPATYYLGSMVLDSTGNVWTWGYNAYGQLGTGDRVSPAYYHGGLKRIPFFVNNKINVVQISAGYHTNFALADDGKVYGWGRGLEGQMGNGTVTTNNPSPVLVSSLPYDQIAVKKISTGTEAASAVYALAEDKATGKSRIFAWGYADGYRIPGASGYTRNAVELTSLFNAVLPAGATIVDIDLGNQHAIVLDSTGQIYTWGYNTDGQLGRGNTTSFSNNPIRVDFFANSGIKIKGISAEFNTSMALDTQGRAWQWGRIYRGPASGSYNRTYNAPGGYTYNYFSSGRLTENGTPFLVEFDLASSLDYVPYTSVPEIAKVVAGRYVNYAIDVYGRVWSWGWNTFYSMGTDGPLFSPAETQKHNSYVDKASLLKTMGDGDTEYYTYHTVAKAPVFSGATETRAFSSQLDIYEVFGQWNPGDGLHPTIYDKKYMVTTDMHDPHGGPIVAMNRTEQARRHAFDYPLDPEGRRLVYVVRRESNSPITYSGNFYVASDSYTGKWIVDNRSTTALPAGVTEVTSTPQVKLEERTWIGLAVALDEKATFAYDGKNLQQMPYITDISTYQSATLFIDNSGNLFKTSLDGSGSIAWGWDFSMKYEGSVAMSANGRAGMGMYDFYNYEIMFQRGVPSLPFSKFSFDATKTKIYLVEDEQGNMPTDKININVSVPQEHNYADSNFVGIRAELKDLRYVFIPYDKSDANFNLQSFTSAEFEAAYNNAAYTIKGDLLSGHPTYGNPPYLQGDYNFEVEVTNNGKMWVMGKDKAYTRELEYKMIHLADNFYTPVEVNHQGIECDDAAHGPNLGQQVYDPTKDNVVKTSTDPADVKPNQPTKYYGFPLDAKNNVIAAPTFGYDTVKASRYEKLPGILELLWNWCEDQAAKQIELVLDGTTINLFADASGAFAAYYLYDFYYDRAYYPPDFTKDADRVAYVPGDEIGYSVSFTIPKKINEIDVNSLDKLVIYDAYEADKMSYKAGSVVLKIGGATLTYGTHYTLTDDQNGLITITIPRANYPFTNIGDKELVIEYTFKTSLNASGRITNKAWIDYLGGDECIVYESNLSKDAAKNKYTPNEELGYTINFIMPEEVSAFNEIKITDVYPANLMSYVSGSAALTIGGAPLTAGVHYTLAHAINNNNEGTVTLILDRRVVGSYNFANDADKVVELKLTFFVYENTRDLIKNDAKVTYDGKPGGEGKKEVELAIGPPTEAEENPGDRKTALLWSDPIGGVVDYYQVKIDDFGWMNIPLNQLTFDPYAGPGGKWYVLFTALPNGDSLVNYVEYTFQIRAVNSEGIPGATFEIKSTPDPIGDLGGRNADLIAIHGFTVRPNNGWLVDYSGTGLSADKPFEATLEIPVSLRYSSIHVFDIGLGRDASIVMYSGSDWANPVTQVDRIGNDMEWIEELPIYLKVTSGNQQNIRYYVITVKMPNLGKSLPVGPQSAPLTAAESDDVDDAVVGESSTADQDMLVSSNQADFDDGEELAAAVSSTIIDDGEDL